MKRKYIYAKSRKPIIPAITAAPTPPNIEAIPLETTPRQIPQKHAPPFCSKVHFVFEHF